MRIFSLALSILTLSALISDSAAQQGRGRPPGAPGGGMGGPPQPRFDKSMQKLFGENSAFSADMIMETKAQSGGMTMPGKIAFLEGKTRFEMDTTKMSGASIPPGAAAQMKQMGMAEIISISRPDKKENYMIYPGLKAYAAVPDPSAETETTADSKEPDLKRTELGKETIDGHPCTKYKVLVKDNDGKEHESTIWTASDLNNFPIKMEMVNEGIPATVTYRNVKLTKPDASLFEPPSDFQRYNDVGTMMREVMMKRFAPPAGGTLPPGATPPPGGPPRQ